MHGDSENSKLNTVLDCPSFPTLPVVAIEVLELTESPDVSMSEIGKVVENDPALSVKILRTVNSSFYGLSKPCPTIHRAITYLGLQVVKSLVLGFSLVDTFSDDRFRDGVFDLESHWRYSIYTAISAKQLAASVPGVDEDQAFTLGLLSGIGILASVLALKSEYHQVLDKANSQWGDPVRKTERDELGFDYIDVTSAFAEKWKFPSDYVQGLRASRKPDAAPQDMKNLALVLSMAIESGATLASDDQRSGIERMWGGKTSELGISSEDRKQIVLSIVRDATELAKLFQLPDDPGVYQQISTRASEAMTSHQLEVARENEQMQTASVTDGLTGLSNRKHFDETVEQTHKDAVENKTPYAVLFFDADRFKSVNDTWGHQAGDEVLKELAKRTSDSVAGSGSTFRYGGEEFCVVCPGKTREEAAAIAEQIRETIAATPVDISSLDLEVSELNITVSIGVAAFEDGSALSPEGLVHAADLGVYAAKQSGRNQVHTAQEDASASEGIATAYASGPGLPEEDPAAFDNSGPLPILIVEDDKLQAKLFALPLKGKDEYHVETAHSGTEALQLIAARKQAGLGPYRLVMTDLNMPGMSGIDLVRNVRSLPEFAKTIFLVLTASEDDQSTKDCMEAGATAVITKKSICDKPKQRVLELIESWTSTGSTTANAA